MVFSSHVFLFYFLPFSLAIYYLLPRRGKHLALTLLSYAFYGWANPRFVFLMLLSTVIDYLCGLIMATGNVAGRGAVQELPAGGSRTRLQKVALVASVVTNLSLLGFFKYFNFGVENYNSLVHLLGLESMELDNVLRVTLPLGISFYTFQSMSYTIDVYRGNARALRNFIDFACYVSMFPQLVAGPIVRFTDVADQLLSRKYSIDKFARGAAIFSVGLAKKVLLANPCGKIADTTFDAVSVTMLDSWYGLVAYAFQIYFDFSGYSDMAIGLGLMLGFVFPKNFDRPYRSESITEFWRRWHISLSSWLRDYLYVPLGGNRRGNRRTYINLALVMLLGGLWHGASWNFVIWGGIHGSVLALERAMGRRTLYHRLPSSLRVGATFFITLITWVFFRAADLGSAVSYLSAMIGVRTASESAGLVSGIIYQPYYILAMAAAAAGVWLSPTRWDVTRNLTWRKVAVCAALLWISIISMSTQSYNPFIYFIF